MLALDVKIRSTHLEIRNRSTSIWHDVRITVVCAEPDGVYTAQLPSLGAGASASLGMCDFFDWGGSRSRRTDIGAELVGTGATIVVMAETPTGPGLWRSNTGPAWKVVVDGLHASQRDPLRGLLREANPNLDQDHVERLFNSNEVVLKDTLSLDDANALMARLHAAGISSRKVRNGTVLLGSS